MKERKKKTGQQLKVIWINEDLSKDKYIAIIKASIILILCG